MVAGRVAPPGRRPIAAGMLAAGVVLWLAGRAGAIVLDDPEHFQVKRTWSASDLGVPAPLGGLVFSPDGGTLYIVGDADEIESALYAVPVSRDATGLVTDLGSATLAFEGTAALDGRPPQIRASQACGLLSRMVSAPIARPRACPRGHLYDAESAG